MADILNASSALSSFVGEKNQDDIYDTSSALSYYDWLNNRNNGISDYDRSIGLANSYGIGKILGKLTGVSDRNTSAYNTYLSNYENKNKYKIASESLQRAGFNPWLAVQNGIGSSAVSSTKDKDDSNNGDIISSALKLLMAVYIGAMKK